MTTNPAAISRPMLIPGRKKELECSVTPTEQISLKAVYSCL